MDIPPTLAPIVSPMTVAVLTLISILAMIVRALFNRKILPVSHHLEIVARYQVAIDERDATIKDVRAERDKWRTLAESMSDQNADLLTNQDLTLSAWNSIKAYVAAKERDL